MILFQNSGKKSATFLSNFFSKMALQERFLFRSVQLPFSFFSSLKHVWLGLLWIWNPPVVQTLVSLKSLINCYFYFSREKKRTLDVRKIYAVLLEDVEFRTLLILLNSKTPGCFTCTHIYMNMNCTVVSHDALHSQFSQNHSKGLKNQNWLALTKVSPLGRLSLPCQILSNCSDHLSSICQSPS